MKSVNTKPVLASLLSKFKLDAEIRDQLEGGTVFKGENGDRLRFHVVVEADQLKIGEDTETKVNAKVPWQTVAMLALSKMNGASRDATIREATTLKGLPEELDAMIKKEAKDIVDELIGQTKQPRKGSTTVKGLSFNVLEAGEAINLPATETIAKSNA